MTSWYKISIVLKKSSVREAVMVEEIKRKLYLEVDKYKAVEKGEYRENLSYLTSKDSYVYKYGFEYIIICVYKLCGSDTVACGILTE